MSGSAQFRVGMKNSQSKNALTHPVALGVVISGALFVVTLAILLPGSGLPPLWRDEAATISAARRSLAALINMLGNVDLVHGLFYMLMHFWIKLVGVTAFWLRFPAVVAFALSVIVIYFIGRKIDPGARPQNPWSAVGLASAIIYMLMPAWLRFATDARSPSTATLVVALATLVFLYATDAPGSNARASSRFRLWALFSVLMTLAILLNIFTAFIFLALAIWAALFRREKGSFTPAALGFGLPAMVLIPFAAKCYSQIDQVYWIDPIGSSTASQVFIQQWFANNIGFAVVFYVALGMLLAPALITASADSGKELIPRAELVFLLFFAWLPTIVLIGATAVGVYVYWPRYLIYSTPAVAVISGLALARLKTWWMVVLAYAMVVALVVPTAIENRGINAKGTEAGDWSTGAAWFEQNKSEGDLVYLGPVSLEIQFLKIAQPQAFLGVVDVAKARSATSAGSLLNEQVPLGEVLGTKRVAKQGLWLFAENWTKTSLSEPAVQKALEAHSLTATKKFSASKLIIVRIESKSR